MPSILMHRIGLETSYHENSETTLFTVVTTAARRMKVPE